MPTEPASNTSSGFEDLLGVREQKNMALALLNSGLERMKLQNESLRLQNAQQNSVVSALQTQQEQEQFRNQMERVASVDPQMVPEAAAQYAEAIGPPPPPAFLDEDAVSGFASPSQRLTEEQLSDPAFREEILGSKEANLVSVLLGLPFNLASGLLGVAGIDIGTSREVFGSDPSAETVLRRLALMNEISAQGRQQAVGLATSQAEADALVRRAEIDAIGRSNTRDPVQDRIERDANNIAFNELAGFTGAGGNPLISGGMIDAALSGDMTLIEAAIEQALEQPEASLEGILENINAAWAKIPSIGQDGAYGSAGYDSPAVNSAKVLLYQKLGVLRGQVQKKIALRDAKTEADRSEAEKPKPKPPSFGAEILKRIVEDAGKPKTVGFGGFQREVTETLEEMVGQLSQQQLSYLVDEFKRRGIKDLSAKEKEIRTLVLRALSK